MNPHELAISNYQYELPDDRIAKYPLAIRDQSKLLHYQAGKIIASKYEQLPTIIPPHSLLVFNSTKVIPARMIFETTSGATIEIFCLEPSATDQPLSKALEETGGSQWNCMIGRKKKWKSGSVYLKTEKVTVEATIKETFETSFSVDFKWAPNELTFAEVLTIAGELPIPPYLNRKTEAIDHERYQTLFAQESGSVAAPTAGLHFTNKLLADLATQSIGHTTVTLHIGAGTFKPVKAAQLADHEMHSERLLVTKTTIVELLSFLQNRPTTAKLIAVGTTSIRTLESLYWIGVKLLVDPSLSISDINIQQWEIYDIKTAISPIEALTAILARLKKEDLTQLESKTQLLIAPPYSYRIVEALITNFHQPSSTLLLLVAALIGEDWRKVYDYALANDFRFLSYGDGCFLEP